MTGFLTSGLYEERSLILSGSELSLRENMNLQKGMNFRDKGNMLSVFLVLKRGGVFTDRWDEGSCRYSYEGHDSVAEGAHGRTDDQLLMYASGKPTDNGTFYKAAHAYKDGMRPEPLPVQIYEKLDPGVWFDKGIFHLIDATYGKEPSEGASRKIARFVLSPADASLPRAERIAWEERMLSATIKVRAWEHDRGSCRVCASQSSLHFLISYPGADEAQSGEAQLRCSAHLERSAKL